MKGRDNLTAGEIRYGEKGGLVRSEGPLTIEEASDFRQALAAALSSQTPTVDLSSVSEIDVTCIQLLFSAAESCQKQGKRIEISGLSQEVREAFEVGGFRYPGITEDK